MADDKPQPPPTNPAAENFSELVTQWERNFNDYANQVMGTENFSQAMNEAQKAQLAWQSTMSGWMTQQLTSMNMPTRDDVLRLGEAIAAVDRRLERIEELVTTKARKKKAAVKKRPARTRKPPTEDSDV